MHKKQTLCECKKSTHVRSISVVVLARPGENKKPGGRSQRLCLLRRAGSPYHQLPEDRQNREPKSGCAARRARGHGRLRRRLVARLSSCRSYPAACVVVCVSSAKDVPARASSRSFVVVCSEGSFSRVLVSDYCFRRSSCCDGGGGGGASVSAGKRGDA